MKLIKNRDEFEQWKSEHIDDDDVAEVPKKFPCFVYSIVTDWSYQKTAAQYLDAVTLNEMLVQVNTAAC